MYTGVFLRFIHGVLDEFREAEAFLFHTRLAYVSDAMKEKDPARALDRIALGSIRSNGYVFQVEMAYLCEKLGFSILEWPIYFEDRRIGKSKMTVPVKLEAAWRVFEIRLRYGGLKKISRVEYQREPA